MDPNHLKEDELQYELMIRGIQSGDGNEMNLLNQYLIAENAGEVSEPTDTQRMTRQTVQREIRDCELKLHNLYTRMFCKQRKLLMMNCLHRCYQELFICKIEFADLNPWQLQAKK